MITSIATTTLTAAVVLMALFLVGCAGLALWGLVDRRVAWVLPRHTLVVAAAFWPVVAATGGIKLWLS